MKKTPVFIVSTSLSLVAILATFYVSRNAIAFADQQTYRHSLTLGPSNRSVAEEWTGSAGEWKREFSLSGVTELGNEYHSNQYGCYVTVYDQELADMTSNDYICRIRAESGHDNKCSLALSFDANGNADIQVGMIETSPDRPIVMLELSYNNSEIHQQVELSMNYSLHYAQDVLFLSGENVLLTLYSVTISYSCTY